MVMNNFSKKEKAVFIGAILFQFILMFLFHDSTMTGALVFIIFLICAVFFIIYLVRNNITRKCKRCGAKGAMQYAGSKVVGERQLKRLKETDSTGRRVQPYYVYGKQVTTREGYRCSKCGSMTFSDSVVDYWDDDNL